MRSIVLPAALTLGWAMACTPGPAEAPDVRILVFSRTEGFRHNAIEPAIEAVTQLAAEQGFVLDATEDPATFNAASLAAYDAVIFLLTTGDVLDSAQEQAFMAFIQAGGGFVGIHSASDTEYDWPWYGGLVGAYFDGHPSNPNVRTGTLFVAAPDHPAAAGLPNPWVRDDEWYEFRDLRPELTVVLTVDETSYKDVAEQPEPDPRPIAWSHAYDAGRAFYTGLGHTAASYADSRFLAHVRGGLRFVLGADPGP